MVLLQSLKVNIWKDINPLAIQMQAMDSFMLSSFSRHAVLKGPTEYSVISFNR